MDVGTSKQVGDIGCSKSVALATDPTDDEEEVCKGEGGKRVLNKNKGEYILVLK